ncbi:MAG TPA: hypothetical protein VGU66_02055 [Candidatus Elarobacter sp.]|nr:hypothetical protein [Candidatus Elarobacter sp.]
MTALVRRSLGLAVVACFALAPAAALADGPATSATPPPARTAVLNFVPPKGWADSTRANGRPGFWKDWTIADGGVVHSFVLSVTNETRRALQYGDAAIAMYKTLPNVTLLEFGPTTACGDVPAFAYAYRSDRTTEHPLIIRHLLVDIGPALGDVSYAHPPGAADRADALDAMTTMCERQIYAMRPPLAWRRSSVPGITAKEAPGVDGYTAPTGNGALIALGVADSVRHGAAALAPAQANAPATVISDAEEACGAVRVRHAVIRTPGKNGAGPEILETVSGYRHGATYFYSYVHPEAERADPDAQRALMSFCDVNAALATPAPATPLPATSPAR